MDKSELNAYRQLAERLDALPNGFPATESGAELRLLAKLYTLEQAELTAQLRPTLETPGQIAERIGGDARALRRRLKAMTRQGLIRAGRIEDGLGYGLLPFVVGIYEMQAATIDEELAQLFETYYQEAFGQALATEPPVHRVVPVGQSIRADMEILPHESVTHLIEQARAWGVMDCICRKQQTLIGSPCPHPVDVCMVLSEQPGAFDHTDSIRALTQAEAVETLQRAAEAELVHSVTNTQRGLSYICNCCTCACGVLRGIAELGIANAVARAPFVNHVDPAQCVSCGACVSHCPFGALSMGADTVQVDPAGCLGCGVCVLSCPEQALSLVRRPAEEVSPPPATQADWDAQRMARRGSQAG